MRYIYINGHFVDESDARISVHDRGFKFGDGIFETIFISNYRPYQFQLHMKRLEKGLASFRINFDISEVQKISNSLIRQNDVKEGVLRIMVTRGKGGRGYLPDSSSKPSVVIETLHKPNTPKAPLKLWLSNTRKIPAECLPVHAKTMQGMNSILARIEADNNGCLEALMLNTNGEICECSSGNIFWFDGEILHTPSLATGIVSGTTRDAVLRLSPFEVKEGIYTIDDLKNATEVFITNAIWRVVSVETLLPMKLRWQTFTKTDTMSELLKKDTE